MKPSALLVAALALPPAAAPAQEPQAFPALDCPRIPVHGPGGAHGADYGLWAAGRGFKASFHDGVAVYPELGPTYPENLPFHWRTVAVVAGGAALPVSRSPNVETSDWRVTFHHGGWKEVYDVLATGLEQSFVIAQRPPHAGELTIHGEITTRLTSAAAGPAHQALVFADDSGRAILEYGAAIAIDADGRRTPATTQFDGKHIVLTVGKAWLDNARFPVTVDPLTTPVLLELAASPLVSTDVCSEPAAGSARDTLVAYSRAYSASDHDVFAILCRHDFQNAVPVFGSLSTSESDTNVTVAYDIAANGLWLAGFERRTPQRSTIVVYSHARGNTAFNSGSFFGIIQAGNMRNPDLGGSADQGVASPLWIVVYELDDGTENHTSMQMLAYDPVARRPVHLEELGVASAIFGFDRHAPSVSQISNGHGWIVVWQELNRQVPGARWTLQAAQIHPNGYERANAPIVVSPTDDFSAPAVAGNRGRYATTFLRARTGVAELQAVSVTWPIINATPLVGSPRTIQSVTPPTSQLQNHGLAYDAETAAFFAATWLSGTQIVVGQTYWSARVARLSLNGAAVEPATVFTAGRLTGNAVAPSVTYSWQHGFPIAYGTTTNNRLYGVALVPPPDASVQPYGTSCSSAALSAQFPWAGNQLFRVAVSGARSLVPIVLVVAAGPAQIPLAGFGMPGCNLLVDPSTLFFTLAGNTSSLGSSSLGFALPDAPVVRGDLFLQAAYAALGANPANLQTTHGLQVRIR